MSSSSTSSELNLLELSCSQLRTPGAFTSILYSMIAEGNTCSAHWNMQIVSLLPAIESGCHEHDLLYCHTLGEADVPSHAPISAEQAAEQVLNNADHSILS